MKKLLLLTAVAGALTLNSCKKDNSVTEGQNIDELTVPGNFTWATSRDISFNVTTSDSRFGDAIHVVSIYAGDPENGGALLSKGSATLINSFKTKIYLPSSLNEVFVVKAAPDGSRVTSKLNITSTSMSVNFTAGGINSALSAAPAKGVSGIRTAAEPACVTSWVPNGDQNQAISTASASDVVCVNLTNNAGIKIEAGNGGTIKLSAPGKTLTVERFNHSKLTLIVEKDTRVEFQNFNLSDDETLINRGYIKVSGSVPHRGTVDNYGTIEMTDDYNFEAKAFTNNAGGIFKVGGSINIKTATKSVNSGTIEVGNTFKVDGASVDNLCRILTKDYVTNGVVTNYSYIKSTGKVEITNNKLQLRDGAIFEAASVETLSGGIHGTGATSLVKVTGSTHINVINNSPRSVSGTIQYCDNSRDVAVLLKDGAVKGCDLYIAGDECKPSNGSNPDRDKDGVADLLDDYPDDPTKAYNNYQANYNVGSAEGGSVVAFEDNWPSKGDFDLNDVVLNYRYKVVTNKSNQVVQVHADYKLLATGGTFSNGAGIQFNIPASKLDKVSGAAVEQGPAQDSLVLILFTDSRKEQSNWNTDDKTKADAKSYSIVIDIKDGPLLSQFGVGNYNIFIWNATKGRGYETHLAGRAATKKADASLFGTADDNSKTGLLYTTNSRSGANAAGLPWGIEVPVHNFAYPLERVSITSAYSKFTTWVSSGGSAEKKWYTFPNNDAVFVK